MARNITVQTTFKLVDTVNNRNWITYSPVPYSRFDKTKTSILFGSSQTEAELTPRDQIIKEAVTKAARAFVSQFLPCEMRYEVFVESSMNKSCQTGVKLLRAEAYAEALSYFKLALGESADDHRAALGAAVAAEAAGDYQQALRFYRRAYGIRPDARYRDARDRLADHLRRIRRGDA